MSWYDNFRQEINRQGQGRLARSNPTAVKCLADIPAEATHEDAFRLTVEVLRIVERTTQAGDPCYFLNCRDGQKIKFSVVAWEWQMEGLGEVDEGKKAILDVRVPKKGFTAFTLARVVQGRRVSVWPITLG